MEEQLVFNNGYCGIEIDFGDDMLRRIAFHLNTGFHFVFTPLGDPAYRHSLMKKDKDGSNLLHFADHLALDISEWSNRVVGKISSWIDLDSDDEILRKDSEITLWEEVHLASNHSLQACLLPTPKGSSCANYVRCVNHILQNLSRMQLLLRIPLEEPDDDYGGGISNDTGELQINSLELWRSFQRQCELKFHNRLLVAFDFPRSLPSANSLECWSDEEVAAAIIDSKTFEKDRQGNPYSREYREKVMFWLLERSIKIVMSGNVQAEILASSATNTSNQDRDYSWHPLTIELCVISYRQRILKGKIKGHDSSEESEDECNFGFGD